MPTELWTPDRNVKIDGVQRDVRLIDPREMTVIRAMHTIAQKHRIALACVACRQPFQGLNAPGGSTEAITCGCRELRAVKHGGIIRP